MNLKKLWKEYSEVIIKVGLNLQRDQLLVVQAPSEAREFVHVLTETAYQVGAKDVHVRWADEELTKLKYRYCSEETLKEVPDWFTAFYNENKDKNAAFLSLVGEDPSLLKDADPQKVKVAIQARSNALKDYYRSVMRDENAWNVAAVSVPSWAKAVFPGDDEKTATKKLWREILNASRISEENSVDAWKSHVETLKEKSDYLNKMNFKALHYTNSKGTDLTVELPEGHIWSGGYGKTKDGTPFVANIPTEEVYTLPRKTGVNGVVYSAKPFNYAGNLIEDFRLKVKDGKIIEAEADRGEKILKQLLSTDDGSKYFGEVALVPYDSPISARNLLFYNTLFDENASCHLAIGKAYPTCLKGSEGKTEEELEKAGVNDSIVHEDFMVGTEDLNIDGITAEGKTVPVFRDGNWA